MALLIGKYGGGIDRKCFADRIREFGTEKEVGLVLKWIEEIYPSCREFCMIDLTNRDKGSMTEHFCRAAMEFGIYDLVFGDSQRIAAEMIRMMQKDAAAVKCCRKTDGTGDGDFCSRAPEMPDWIHMDGRENQKGKQFGSHKIFGNINREYDCSVRFRFMWDDSFLWFYTIVNHGELVFHPYIDDEAMFADDDQDFIRLHFDTNERSRGEAFAMGIVIKPQLDAEGKLKVFLHKDIGGNDGKESVPENAYISKISTAEDGYYLEVGIRWEALSLFPGQGTEIYIDVLAGTAETEITWQNPSYYIWYNVAEYGKMLLL